MNDGPFADSVNRLMHRAQRALHDAATDADARAAALAAVQAVLIHQGIPRGGDAKQVMAFRSLATKFHVRVSGAMDALFERADCTDQLSRNIAVAVAEFLAVCAAVIEATDADAWDASDVPPERQMNASELNELECFRARLSEFLRDPAEAYLFGSRASSEARGGSDWDILLLVSDADASVGPFLKAAARECFDDPLDLTYYGATLWEKLRPDTAVLRWEIAHRSVRLL